ncbi:MAG: serine/threonine protein kinase [Oleiphilaceae bacterium]|jgi:serine/threonine protein kinase
MKEGRYEYQDKIGEGGMATVYRGVQLSLDRPVAIKVLSATLSDNPSIIKLFKRESLIIARLNHPNIIHVIDRGTTTKGRPVFVMEFVKGVNLADAIRDNLYGFNQKVDVVIQLCKGVAYAHKLDVIHRDIKPANIIVDEEGFAKLLDFGIASFFKAEKEDGPAETDLVMGTEAYMAPEQHQGISETSTLSDIYSLGVVMYELFSGGLPANDFTQLQVAPNMTPVLVDLITECLAPSPEDRPSSIDDVRTRLLVAMKGQHIAEDKASRAGEGLAAIKNKFGLLDVLQEDKHGAVYLYEDKATHKLLVIKKRTESVAGYREAKILHALKHPNLVNVLGTSKNGNVFIVVMGYISGGSLQERLIQPMALQLFLDLAVQMSRGLSFAHQNRIFHGNLRPSNVLLSADMKVRVSDFGLDEHYRVRANEKSWYGERGVEKDELSDIFSLGAIFYHALTGVPPDFKDGSVVKTQLFTTLPLDLQRLVGRMLSKDRYARPQSVESIISELLPLVVEPKTAIKSIEAVPVILETIKDDPKRKLSWQFVLISMLAVMSVTLNVFFLRDDGGFLRELILEQWVVWIQLTGLN